MIAIAISTVSAPDGECAQAVSTAGAEPMLLDFDVSTLDAQIARVGGVLVTGGGGDVDPQLYGGTMTLAAGIDERRDTFELALVRRARERQIPTLCICRGYQLANVAFGGTLIGDIGTSFGSAAGSRHRVVIDGKTERGVIAGHDVAIRSGSLLSSIVPNLQLATGSRHHQSIATVAPDLTVVASTSDGIVEAVEARFPSPFWLGVQWHPESTLTADDGASRAIFAAFVAAASAYSAQREVLEAGWGREPH